MKVVEVVEVGKICLPGVSRGDDPSFCGSMEGATSLKTNRMQGTAGGTEN